MAAELGWVCRGGAGLERPSSGEAPWILDACQVRFLSLLEGMLGITWCNDFQALFKRENSFFKFKNTFFLNYNIKWEADI